MVTLAGVSQSREPASEKRWTRTLVVSRQAIVALDEATTAMGSGVAAGGGPSRGL